MLDDLTYKRIDDANGDITFRVIRADSNPFARFNTLGRPPKGALVTDSTGGSFSPPATESNIGSWFMKASILLDGKTITETYSYGGLSATGYLGYVDRDQYQEKRPDYVVYGLGLNDMPASGSSLTPAERTTIRNAVITALQNIQTFMSSWNGIVIITKLLPSTSKDATEIALHNAWIDTVPGLVPGVVVWSGPANIYDPSIFANTIDGVHPNNVGANIIAKAFKTWFGPYLSGVTTIRQLQTSLGATGRLFAREPSTTANYGGGDTPTTVTTATGELDAAHAIVNYTSSSTQNRMWFGSAVAENNWTLITMRLNGSIIDDTNGASYEIGVGDNNDTNYPIRHEGQFDTEGAWGTFATLVKTRAGSTQIVARMRTRAQDSDELPYVIDYKDAELTKYQCSAMTGINWNLP